MSNLLTDKLSKYLELNIPPAPFLDELHFEVFFNPGRIVIGTVRVGWETMGKEPIEFQNVKKLHQKHFSRTSKIFQIQKNSFDDVAQLQ